MKLTVCSFWFSLGVGGTALAWLGLVTFTAAACSALVIVGAGAGGAGKGSVSDVSSKSMTKGWPGLGAFVEGVDSPGESVFLKGFPTGSGECRLGVT